MKTLLRLMKRFGLLLVSQANYPTPRQRLWNLYTIGKCEGRKEALKELPITKVQPAMPKLETEPLHLPPGEWMKQWLKTHPEHRVPLPSQPAYWPAPFEEHAWLNSKPKAAQVDPYDTTESPAIVALLHQEKNNNGHH